MITDWIKVTRIIVSGADRLYPNDIDWEIEPGINAVIGGTGLGKTTLLYALQFAVFGKLVVDADERIEREFFKDRLTKRVGKKLAANPTVVHAEFTAGGSHFVVKRNLLTGALLKVSCDQKEVKTNKYEETLAAKVGLPGDFHSLVRLHGSLLFFGEGRYLLAWDNHAQHELVNLMMSDHATYVKLGELWSKAESADSAARNISAQAVRLEKDLEALSQEESKVAKLTRISEEKRFTRTHTEVEAELAAIRKNISRETNLEETQTAGIAKSDTEFHEELSGLEATLSGDLDDSLLVAAMASPTVASIRHSLEKFYGAPDDRGCPCCGRAGIATAVASLVKNAAASARDGNCVICSKSLPQANGASSASAALDSKSAQTDSKAHALQSLLFQREQTRSRLADLRKQEGAALQALAEASEAQLEYIQENPGDVANTLRITVKQMRAREAVAKKERDKQLANLKKELTKTNAVFDDIQAKIAKAFKKYASLYLDENCDVVFLKEADLPGKRGPQIKAPHAAFFPVVSGETRPSAQALSDAQRSFVDLAFRMAVLDVWHQKTKKTVTMIIETPEGAVDIAYMERVATMIRTFGDQGHTLLISTNLNNTIFLPEVMAAWPKSSRKKHILNLLEKGIPRPVQIQHRPHFNMILESVAAHRVAK